MFNFLLSVIGVLSVSNIVLMCINMDAEKALTAEREKNRMLSNAFNEVGTKIDMMQSFESEC